MGPISFLRIELVMEKSYAKQHHLTYLSLSFRSRKRRGMMGIMLPSTQTAKTVVIGRPIHTPTGTAPRSSTTGSAEIIARTPRSGIPNDRKKFAIFCPV
jgi:hypothetical protein